ncbi:MAG: hypothetical protein M1832_000218 [Thelocarpon impressellum]|nr:MAG: hypothetical protein M1832_000218 [Thelocarpon impressellum]
MPITSTPTPGPTGTTAFQRAPPGTSVVANAGSRKPGATASRAHGHRPAALTRRPTDPRAPRAPARTGSGAEQADENGGMAASFLQYCASCEKQIRVPDHSVLYCSESCRKVDSSKPSPPLQPSPPWTPLSRPSLDGPQRAPRDIVPPASPTALVLPRPVRHAVDDRDSWPGSSPAASPASTAPHVARRSSYVPARTPPASYGTFPSASVSYSSAGFSRPLPPRHNPTYSTSASPRSLDLVTPYTHAYAPPTLPAAAAAAMSGAVKSEGDMRVLYAKRPAPAPNGSDGGGARPADAQGGLGGYFALSAAQPGWR